MKKLWSSSSFACQSNSMSESGSSVHSIAQYIEDYIDLVENVPNDLARHITRLHEYNNRYYQLLDQLKSSLCILASDEYQSPNLPDVIVNGTDSGSSVASLLSKLNKEDRRAARSLIQLQRCLIEIQEISDEKLFISQKILDQLDTKSRQLDHDHRIVTNGTNHSSLSSKNVSSNLNTHNTASVSHYGSNDTATSSTARGANVTGGDFVNKEPNSSNTNCSNGSNSNGNSGNNLGSKRSSSRRNNNGKNVDSNEIGKRGVKRGGGVKTTGKEVKRNKGKERDNPPRDYSPPMLYDDALVEADEPTYCLCEQISYGEMICCDNSACQIEWFHFQCVNLATKPKGKWYCPNCRGDRSNIPKK